MQPSKPVLSMRFARLSLRPDIETEVRMAEYCETVREWIAIGERRALRRRSEAFVKGMDNGWATALTKLLTLVLRKRYGEAAADLITRAEAQADPFVVERWLDSVFDAVVSDAPLHDVRAAFTER
jgi:hypothetical protein